MSAAPAQSGFRHSFRALAIRDYRNYWIGGLGMTGAQGISQLSLPWLVLDLTGSLGQLGIVISIQGVAWTIVALIGGVLADRYSRRSILVGGNVVTIASLVILAVLTIQGLVEVWQVYVSSLLLGANQALTMPARTAIMRSLVGPEDMMNAVALNSMQLHSVRVLWPALGGIIIGVLGVGPALLTGAACSGVAVFMLSLLRHIVEPPRPPAASPVREIREGLRYSFSTPVLRMLMVINFAVAFFGLAFLNMQPGFSREALGFDAATTGLFIMASGIGSVGGSVGLVFYEVRERNRFVLLATAGFGLAILLLCLNPWNPLSFLIMVFFGFSNSALAVTAQTIFQTESEPKYLGRVVSLWSMGGGIGALTALPLGVAGDEFGLRWALGSVSFVLVVLCGYLAFTMLPAAIEAGRKPASVLNQLQK